MKALTKDNLPLIGGIITAVVMLLAAGVAHANPSIFAAGTATSAATTSPVFMTPGAATTTLVHDSHAQTFSGGAAYKTDEVGLLIQLTGSSTSAILGLAVEYSQDGIDWYRNYVIDPNQVGTTTALGIGAPFSTTYRATTAVIGGLGAASNYSTAAIMIPTPFRYTRVVATMTGANAALWMQLVPIKEQR